MGLEPKVVPLRPRGPHLDQPEHVAFKSVLRNLYYLAELPAEKWANTEYGFGHLIGGTFTAEQVLDEIDMCTANIRVKLGNERARTSKE